MVLVYSLPVHPAGAAGETLKPRPVADFAYCTMLVLVMYRYLLKVQLLLCKRHNKIWISAIGQIHVSIEFSTLVYILSLERKTLPNCLALRYSVLLRAGTLFWEMSVRFLSLLETGQRKLRAGLPGLWIPTSAKEFSLLQDTQTGSGAYPASKSVDLSRG
jgi:hypothetical protein